MRITGHSQKSLMKQYVLFSLFLPDLTRDTLLLLNSLLLSYRAALSVSQMNKINMKATDSRVRVLKELDIVELDKQGNVKSVV